MKLVILGRDGTINENSGAFVTSVDEWQPLPGALEAIARLNQAGYTVVVASNQPGLGRGLFDAGALNAMHARMHKLLAAAGGRIDAIFFCPHTPDEGCDCHKPKPGLFLQIAERYGIPLRGVPVAGDELRDLQAAAAAGCEPHLVQTGRGAQACPNGTAPPDFPTGTQVHADLGAFADAIIARDAQPLALAV